MHTLSPFALAFRDRAEDSCSRSPLVPPPFPRTLPSSRIVLRDRACPTFPPVPDFRGVMRAFARNERELLPPSRRGHPGGGGGKGGGNNLPWVFRESTRSSSLSAIIHVHFARSPDLRCYVTIQLMAKQFLCAKVDIVLRQVGSSRQVMLWRFLISTFFFLSP